MLNVVNKQLIGKLSVVGLALLLAGCGAQSATSKSTASSSGSSAIENIQKVNITDSNMPPEEVSSLVTLYSSKKYGGDWAKVAKDAQKDGLRTNLYDTSDYKLDNAGATGEDGSGILYNAAPEKNSADVAYTLNQDGSINIYENVKKGQKADMLGTVSQDDMVNYINKNSQGSKAQKLAKISKVYDERSGRNSQANHEFGRQAVFTTPKAMRGVWYSSDGNQQTTLTIREHTISVSTNGNTTKSWLYKQYADFLSSPDAKNPSVQRLTKDWQSAKMVDAHDMNWLNIRGWCDTENKGEFYVLHRETINDKKTTVLVSANGDKVTTDNVFYKSQSMAQKQANHHYADLDYPQSPEGEDEVNN